MLGLAPLLESTDSTALRNQLLRTGATGIAGAESLTGAVSDLTGQIDPATLAGLRSNVSQLTGELGGATIDNLTGEVLGPGAQFDPNILQSPFFQALQAEATRNLEQSAAGRGRVGAGDTKGAIGRQSLLLGQQFGQQDLQNRLQAQSQRFNQLLQGVGVRERDIGRQLGAQAQRFGQLGFGAQFEQQDIAQQLGAQAQRFGQVGAAAEFGLGVEQQTFQNLSQVEQQDFLNRLGINQQAFQQLSQTQQQDFVNQLTTQQQGFGQLFDLLRIGQASAAGTAAGGTASAQDLSGLLTGIGNVQASGEIAGANLLTQRSGGIQDAASLAAILKFSDRRLKTHIQFVGKTPGGNNWYSFDYIWGASSEGVMSDEVRHIDGAVLRHPSGFDMVDYGVIT